MGFWPRRFNLANATENPKNAIFKHDKFMRSKKAYSFQKNPGITKNEVIKIAEKICEIDEINFDKFNIKNLYPGLIVFEKSD